jgi:NADH-ubiquinone oxidoreductase chain 1
MTEHAAIIFVFFFLAEYASIVLICILISILFVGGYLLDTTPMIYLIQNTKLEFSINQENLSVLDSLIEGIFYGVVLAFKTCLMIFVFI